MKIRKFTAWLISAVLTLTAGITANPQNSNLTDIITPVTAEAANDELFVGSTTAFSQNPLLTANTTTWAFIIRNTRNTLKYPTATTVPNLLRYRRR